MNQIEYGFCQCGCGQPTPISTTNNVTLGYIKGQPFKYVSSHSSRVTRGPDVYLRRRVAGSRHGSVLEHVLIAEKALGHALPAKSHVHHVDENKRNNANTNLVICQDQAYHKLLHARARTVRAGGDPNTERQCTRCLIVKPFDAFSKMSRNNSTGRRSECRECSALRFAEWRKTIGHTIREETLKSIDCRLDDDDLTGYDYTGGGR